MLGGAANKVNRSTRVKRVTGIERDIQQSEQVADKLTKDFAAPW
jgi:hypothetical protein